MEPLWGLWVGWLRVGVMGFGGGPSVVPLIKTECRTWGWMGDEDFLDMLALGNTLPGPIAVKLAVAIGSRVAGAPGAVVALLAMCLPGVTLMLVLAGIFARFKEHPGVAGMSRGARAAVVGMLFWTALELAPDGVKDVRAGVLAVMALGALLGGIHPGWVMAGALVVGWFGMRG